MDCLLTILREEFARYLQAVFLGVSLQDGSKRLPPPALAVVCLGGDVRYVWA